MALACRLIIIRLLRLVALAEVVVSELHHLGDRLGREDGELIRDQQEPMRLIASLLPRHDSCQSYPLAILGSPSPPVDQRHVEPVHIVVLIIDEEAVSHCRVSVVAGVDEESWVKITYSISSGFKVWFRDSMISPIRLIQQVPQSGSLVIVQDP